MKLVWKKSFHEFVYEEREIADNKALLRQMRVPSLPEVRVLYACVRMFVCKRICVFLCLDYF